MTTGIVITLIFSSACWVFSVVINKVLQLAFNQTSVVCIWEFKRSFGKYALIECNNCNKIGAGRLMRQMMNLISDTSCLKLL